MADDPQSLSACYSEAEALRLKLDTFLASNTPDFQDLIASTISKYATCKRIASQIALFSPNESIDDISSRDLRYFLLHFQIAELLFRTNIGERRETLFHARSELEAYLKLLDQYDILSKADMKLVERYQEDKDNFSIASSGDAALRRENKIERFREEKALRLKIEQLKRDPFAFQNDESVARELYLSEIAMSTHRAFASLESVALEIQMLKRAPPVQLQQDQAQEGDLRTRGIEANGYSERLDGSVAELLKGAAGGPILSKEGRPIRPFTLLDSRQRLQAGVFRPDHSLPTMTIDEYLEEERKRGGIIEGGGEASMQKEYVDEDDLVKADEATEKARYWDAFKEDNPKGAGNTMNRG